MRSAGATSDVWLELRAGAIEWIAQGRASWWHKATPTRAKRLNIPQIVADTGLSSSTAYRILGNVKGGADSPVRLQGETIARLVHLGATERGVATQTAFVHIFNVRTNRSEMAAAA